MLLPASMILFYQDYEVLKEILSLKKAGFSPKKVVSEVLWYCYFVGLTFALQLLSPNDLLHDTHDGGRAAIYILCFGTKILVLQMLICHLCGKELNLWASMPYRISNLILTVYVIGISIPTTRVILAPWENIINWSIAIYLASNAVYLFIRIIAQLEVLTGKKWYQGLPKLSPKKED